MPSSSDSCELSIVMPCLNEADTIERCIKIAQKAMRDHGIDGEVVVADNGSTDGSPELAAALGARVVHVAAKGYGNALKGGIEAAQGRFVIMGDADESYDFAEAPKFVEKLRQGYDLVQGCRLPSGGGSVAPGAMPVTHRWIGNPMFSLMARVMFRAPIHDIYCGLRGFTKAFYETLQMRCTGMEFATEMIIKASLRRARITEVPITLHPDGRKAHAPHLRTIRDGWRTLRFFLMYSPRWLFAFPGILLGLLGVGGYLLTLLGASFSGITLGAHTMLVAGMLIILGFNIFISGLIAKTFAIKEGFLPSDPKLTRFFKIATLERGLLLGTAGIAAGAVCIFSVLRHWVGIHFAHLNYESTMPWIGTGILFIILGAQLIFSSFLVSLVGIDRK